MRKTIRNLLLVTVLLSGPATAGPVVNMNHMLITHVMLTNEGYSLWPGNTKVGQAVYEHRRSIVIVEHDGINVESATIVFLPGCGEEPFAAMAIVFAAITDCEGTPEEFVRIVRRVVNGLKLSQSTSFRLAGVSVKAEKLHQEKTIIVKVGKR
ncbi:MAG: hypothetical protein N3E40_00220 [Dehalococcoidia bacterium]|nr:hypothetical protein [Dehalococcoidia bacterium]